MAYHSGLDGETYRFDTLKALLAAASPARSGDSMAGLGAANSAERVAARYALADVPLRDFLHTVLVPYETDKVTRLTVDGHDAAAFAPVSHLAVSGLRDWLLSYAPDERALAALAPGPMPEMVAGASKLT